MRAETHAPLPLLEIAKIWEEETELPRFPRPLNTERQGGLEDITLAFTLASSRGYED